MTEKKLGEMTPDREPTIRQMVQAALRTIGRAPVAEALDHEAVTILAVFSAEELLSFGQAVAAQVEQETRVRIEALERLEPCIGLPDALMWAPTDQSGRYVRRGDVERAIRSAAGREEER